EIHTESAAGTDSAAAPVPAAAGRPLAHPADVGPLPRSATVLFGINVGPGTGPSMVERIHGWGAADLSASFIGPPRPDEQLTQELAAAIVSADWADHSVVLNDISISSEAGTDESADNSEADSTEFGSESGGEAIGDSTMVDTPVRRTPIGDTAQMIETRSEG